MATIPQFFQTLRPLRKVGKLRGTVDVPAFTAPCGTTASYYASAIADYFICTDSGTALTQSFTIKFWIKPNASDNVSTYNYIFTNDNVPTANLAPLAIWIGFDLKVRVTLQATVVAVGNTELNYDQWYYIAVTYNYADDTVLIYVDGLVDGQGSIIGPTGVGDSQYYIGEYNGDLAYYLSSLEVYNYVMTADELEFYRYRMSSFGAPGLLLQFYLREHPFINTVTGHSFSKLGGSMVNDFPHNTWYGSSFIAGIFTIATNSIPFSVKFPVDKPTRTTNFVPCFSWVDEIDGVTIHRYKLWNVSRFDINPLPATYLGQKLPSTVTLEIWNIDGNTTVDMTTTLEMLTSILHIVSDATSTTLTSDLSTPVVIDTTLSSLFPLTFPIAFNTQQTY